MTSVTDVFNRALQTIGTRTTVTDAEVAANSTNEAIQANLIYAQLRDNLLRMAPWNCAISYANLTYITSAPGTPENPTGGTTLWQKGQPPPPWAYEYQYPVDCLRACFIVPQFTTGFASGIPITTAVTGGAPSFWNGPPIVFKVVIDQFFSVTAAAVAAGGLGYAVGDIITLADTPAGSVPIGAPAQLRVATIGGGGAVATVAVVNQIAGSAAPLGGSYFQVQTNPIAAESAVGTQGASAGAGATFNLTFETTQRSQRVIVTNQEFGLLGYIKQTTDPNLWDPLFADALNNILGARLTMALTGDKQIANMLAMQANGMVAEARKADGNEGLTVNNITPDWIRSRGGNSDNLGWTSNNMSFDWGPLFTPF